MSAPADVEVTTRYVATVADLPAAWQFVMARIDSVGPDPRITISPIRVYPVSEIAHGLSDDDATYVPEREFEVTVEGMVREGQK